VTSGDPKKLISAIDRTGRVAAKAWDQLRHFHGRAGRSNMPVSLNSVLSTWAALMALWTLPYLTLLDRLRLDSARSEVLQWSLLFIGIFGVGSVLYIAWQDTLDRRWRAAHGLPPRAKSKTRR
jgi:hypothetical protein